MSAGGRSLWVGIDEAGYGPNLGPLVMTAVIAEGPARPDVWRDLAATVGRAGAAGGRLWVDDSKRLHRGAARPGRNPLERTALATLAAVNGGSVPHDVAGWLEAVGAGSLRDSELADWLDGPSARTDIGVPAVAERPFDGAPWRLVAVRSEVVGPARFNAELEAGGGSKAAVHFGAFARLLWWIWGEVLPDRPSHVTSDKHGGRHFYYDPLAAAFPGVWIDRGEEGPALSRYVLREGPRRLTLALTPRADADDGLVALASVVSKALRERWMGVFNDFWLARIPGLRPSAGYPVDAARFREAIAPTAAALELDSTTWWRRK